MIKEKLIFWPLLAVFIGILVFGVSSQGTNKLTSEELLKDIDSAAKKSKSKNKDLKDTMDIARVMSDEDVLGSYITLTERSPFFRIMPEERIDRPDAIVVEEPRKKAAFKYKGMAMMGDRVRVVVEDEATGKSFFVQEGDKVGDFVVATIDAKKVVLKKGDAEEIILSVTKKDTGVSGEKTDRKGAEEK